VSFSALQTIFISMAVKDETRMSERLFIDTPALVAAVHHGHEFAQDAATLWKSLADNEREWQLVTSDLCLADAYTQLRRVSPAHAVLGGELQRLSIVHRLPLTDADYQRAWYHLRHKRWDKLCFEDSLHFALLEREDIRLVFTSNRYYARAGFKIFTEETQR
jgi:predicted nucleic acid-binding protein